jgi:ligand-binding sensor domain-containing protein
MWAGTGNSVWRSTDQGVTWTSKSISELVEGITSNPNNKNEVYVVTQGTGAKQKHFFKSDDGGATFTSPATNFPNIGCWCIAFNPKDGNLFVGTDKGVVYSYDKGVTWNPLNNALPLTEVMSLKIKGFGSDTLLAGTYGRGMFWLDLSQIQGVKGAEAPLPIAIESYPNPITTSAATISFTLKNAGLATITLHDVLGKELRILEKSYFAAGEHKISLSTNDLAKGTYFLMLTSNGKSVFQKITVE